jgi:hypothetical protein
MGTLPVTAGGALKMIAAPTVLTAVTVVTAVIMTTKVHTLLLPMESTQAGTMTRGLLNISLVS